MATFTVDFLGCKVSYADAQEIRERLLSEGHDEAPGTADVAVISTCCVTAESVAKSRKAARRAAAAGSRVFLTGCAANLDGAFLDMPAGVTVVRRRSEETPAAVAGAIGPIGCVEDTHGPDRIRSFVKIQDGCSFACAFCVIPTVRGASRSRPAAAVLGEIRRRVDQGHREVVLTGINLGCYRDRAAGVSLPDLVRRAAATPGLARLRLSSVEVNHLTDELLDALRSSPVVSPHLHVPLQSGDDAVLRAMGRRYTAATFLKRVGRASGFNLTTDVIVGFPGEDDVAFGNTVSVLEAAGVTRVHVFPYSPRPGTRTGQDDTVPAPVKRERGAALRALSDRASAARWEARIGEEDEVLLDRPGRGYASDYTPWLVDGEQGELVRARAVGTCAEGVVGAR